MSSSLATATDFLGALRAGTAPAGAECRVPLARSADGRRISLPVKLVRRPAGALRGRPLVASFQGALDQKHRGFPHFGTAHLAGDVSGTDAVVLALGDPSLWLAPNLRTAWYAANRHVDVPEAIAGFLAAAARALAPRRLILAGSSTGGHAALVQASRLPDCVCLVFNPVPRISTYRPNAVARFLAACWGIPSVPGTPPPLPGGVLDDCGTLYHAGHAHTLIVLQNATDPHLAGQVLPFVRQVRDVARLLLISGVFPESLGHSYPHADRAAWIAAAIRAPDIAPGEIAQVHAASAEAAGPVPARRAARAGGPPSPARDRELAARLAAAARR